MKQSSMRCPEVRNGEIIPIITTKSILVLEWSGCSVKGSITINFIVGSW